MKIITDESLDYPTPKHGLAHDLGEQGRPCPKWAKGDPGLVDAWKAGHDAWGDLPGFVVQD
jgi:hypothetical protein